MHSISLWSPVVQFTKAGLTASSFPITAKSAKCWAESCSDINKQLANPTVFNEKTLWKDTHLILRHAAKQTWSQSSTLHIQNARPWGRTFQSNSPLSGGHVWSNAQHLSCLPPRAKHWYVHHNFILYKLTIVHGAKLGCIYLKLTVVAQSTCLEIKNVQKVQGQWKRKNDRFRFNSPSVLEKLEKALKNYAIIVVSFAIVGKVFLG